MAAAAAGKAEQPMMVELSAECVRGDVIQEGLYDFDSGGGR